MKTCTTHPEKKAHRRELCKSCYERFLRERSPEYAARETARVRAWVEQNREQSREIKQKWRAANPDVEAAYREKNKERLRARAREYAAVNAEAACVRSRAWYEANRERAATTRDEYYKKNSGAICAKTRAWTAANPERKQATDRAWRVANPYKVRANKLRRRVCEQQASVAWADKEALEDIYLEAAYLQLEIDHIVPLRGKLVCGLHVPENLQLLTRAANAQKSNKFDPHTFVGS